MQTFRREGAAYLAELEPPERAVLLEVVDDVVALLAGRSPVSGGAPGAGGVEDADGPGGPAEERWLQEVLDALETDPAPVEPPSDPALLRLLPDASTDEDAAAELRRLTEADVRRSKLARLTVLRAGIEAARPGLLVQPAEAADVAATLTDVRLVASERLGVRTDDDGDALYRLVLEGGGADDDSDDEAAHRLLATVYVMLSLLQESLVELMLGDLPGPDAPDTARRRGDGAG